MAATSLVDWAIRATLLLAVALPLARLLARRSATTAHRLLATVFLCILVVLPLCMTAAPGWQWTMPTWKAAATVESPIDAERASHRTALDVEHKDAGAEGELSALAEADAFHEPQQSGGGVLPPASVGESSRQDNAGAALAASVRPTRQEDSTNLAADRRPMSWRQIVTIAWLAIAGVLALRFAYFVNRLRRIVSSCGMAPPALSKQVHRLSLQCGLDRRVRALLSDPGSMPMACWLGRWTIVVPEDFESWPEELREVTLLHELGHIARRDAWADYLAQCVACLLWPNPIAWVAAKDARRLRERACDEWSLPRYRGGARQYALSLVEVVRRCQPPECRIACALADQRGLESRLRWLFSSAASRNSWALLRVPATLVALGLAVAVATAEPTDAPRSEGSQAPSPESVQVTVSSEPSPKAPVLSVSGTVKDAAGNPLNGASVVLRANLGGVPYARLQHARDVLARTTTNSQGQFDFADIGLPPRLIDVIDQLRQGKPGVQVLAWADGAGLQWKPVGSFNEMGIEFLLQSEADVSGIVSDENGAALTEGELRVIGFTKASDNLDGFLGGPGDLNTIHSEVRFSGTIREGRFTLANMPEDYRISVRFDDRSGRRAFFVIDTGTGTLTEITYQNAGLKPTPVHRTPIRATAKQQPCVRIQVVDDQGQPVAGGGVEAVDSERRYGGSAAVGDDGIAILSVNNPGVHDVYYAGDPLNPVLGLVQKIDIQPDGGGPDGGNIVEMRLPASRTLVGKVVDGDTGESVPGVYVSGGYAAEGDAMPRVTGSMAVSDVDGRFELPVREGFCKLSIRHEVDGYSVPTYSARRSVNGPDLGPEPAYPAMTVAAENPLGEVVIRIARGLVVNGRVLDQQGLPVRGLHVTAANERSRYRQTATFTDADGRFRLAGLSPYVPTRIAAWSKSGAAEQIIAATDDHPWERSLTKSVELKLVAGTIVAGRVTKGGRPAPGVNVRLRRAAPPEPGEQGVRFSLLGETITDEQGKYRLGGLAKGDRYYLEVEPQEGAEVRDWRYTMPYSQTVEVENGATLELPDAELKTNGQTLVGLVVDPDGNPVEGITVSARLASGMHLSRPQNGPPPWTETDGQGRFKLTHLPDEPISLMAYKANPAGGRILHPGHASPEMNADDIRIVFDPSLLEEPEDLD